MRFLLQFLALTNFASTLIKLGQCSTKQTPFVRKLKRYLANNVFESRQTGSELECAMQCVKHGSCVSANYKFSGIGKGLCELNEDALHESSGADEQTNPDFNHLYIIQEILSKQKPSDTVQQPTTCSALLKKIPSSRSGLHYLYPQGLVSSPAVQVYCDMTSKSGVGVTVIGHDSESRKFVNGYNSAGSYKRNIIYDIPMEQIVAIMNQSNHCEQFIKYECYHARIFNGGYSWWVSRQGSKMSYWGGAAVNSGKCACGMTNSCAGGANCNCDKNDYTWREDSGYLTDKDTLPVTQLRFGDTGSSEKGYHTLGKLQCWG